MNYRERYLKLLLPKNQYQDYYYLASSLTNSDIQKRGRFCLTWIEEKTQSFVKFYGSYHQDMHLKELALSDRFSKQNFSLTPTFSEGCVLKYPICELVTGVESHLKDQWMEFFSFLREERIICLDVAFEQFVIDDQGRLKLTDFKFCLEKQSTSDWSFWFRSGLIPFSRRGNFSMPMGYGHIIQSKLAVLKMAWESQRS